MMMSLEETRRWMMAPSDIVRYNLRCSIGQKNENVVGKVALMWPKYSRERWWWRIGWLGWEKWESWESWESEQVGLTTLVQSPGVITLTSWS